MIARFAPGYLSPANAFAPRHAGKTMPQIPSVGAGRHAVGQVPEHRTAHRNARVHSSSHLLTGVLWRAGLCGLEHMMQWNSWPKSAGIIGRRKAVARYAALVRVQGASSKWVLQGAHVIVAVTDIAADMQVSRRSRLLPTDIPNYRSHWGCPGRRGQRLSV